MGRKKDEIKSDTIKLLNHATDNRAEIAELEAQRDLLSFQVWCRERIAEGYKPEASDRTDLIELYLNRHMIRCERSLVRAMEDLTALAEEAQLVSAKPDSPDNHALRVGFLDQLATFANEHWIKILAQHKAHHAGLSR